jgi:hypothetical protein
LGYYILMTFFQAFARLLRFIVTYFAGALLVATLSLRLYWGDWGKNDGASILFGFGVALTLLSIALNYIELE